MLLTRLGKGMPWLHPGRELEERPRDVPPQATLSGSLTHGWAGPAGAPPTAAGPAPDHAHLPLSAPHRQAGK